MFLSCQLTCALEWSTYFHSMLIYGRPMTGAWPIWRWIWGMAAFRRANNSQLSLGHDLLLGQDSSASTAEPSRICMSKHVWCWWLMTIIHVSTYWLHMRIFLECVPYIARRDLITNTKTISFSTMEVYQQVSSLSIASFLLFNLTISCCFNSWVGEFPQNKIPGPWATCCERLVCPTMMLTLSNTTSWQTHEKRLTYYIITCPIKQQTDKIW